MAHHLFKYYNRNACEHINQNQLLQFNIFYRLQVKDMENYHQFSQAPIFVKKQPFSTVPFQEKYLKMALALNIIKSATGRCRIKRFAFSFKQIQISRVKLVSNGSEVHLLQDRIKKREDSISDIRHSHIHKEKSMELLRNIKGSLGKQRNFHSQSVSTRQLFGSLNSQKNKILDQITEKLQIKNRIPLSTVEKPIQTLQLNKRVAKLESFMQQIKKERQITQKPVFVHEKQKINRINVHMLEEKLNEERKKSEVKQIFTNIQEIKGQIKRIQKNHESLLKQSEKSIDLSNKTPQIHNFCPVQPIKQIKYQQHFAIKAPQPIYFQPRQQIVHQNNVRNLVQSFQSPIHTFQVPKINLYNVVPKGQPIVPALIIPANNYPHTKRPNTDRIVYQNIPILSQQMLRRPKFSFKILS